MPLHASVQRYKPEVIILHSTTKAEGPEAAPMWLFQPRSAGVHNEVKDPHIERRFRAEYYGSAWREEATIFMLCTCGKIDAPSLVAYS
jgi:hypothetical protein